MKKEIFKKKVEKLAHLIQQKFGYYYGTHQKIVDEEKSELKNSDKWKLSYHELKTLLEKYKITDDTFLYKLEVYNKKCKIDCEIDGEYDEEMANNFFKKIPSNTTCRSNKYTQSSLEFRRSIILYPTSVSWRAL